MGLVARVLFEYFETKGRNPKVEEYSNMSTSPGSNPPILKPALLADLLSDLLSEAERAHLAWQSGKALGPVTGLAKIDKALGGFLAPGLHVLAGSPGAGKTALALQMLSSCGTPALYVSAEMSRLEILRRLIARSTQTFLERLKTGELSRAEVERLALATVSKLPAVAVCDAIGLPVAPENMRGLAGKLRSQFGDERLLIVVDSLHAWARAWGGLDASEFDALAVALQELVQLAHSINAPVLLVAHRNRASQTNGGLFSARGSSNIEYLCESFLGLDVDKGAKWDASGEKEVTFTVEKNRNGAGGSTVALKFSGRLQNFREL